MATREGKNTAEEEKLSLQPVSAVPSSHRRKLGTSLRFFVAAFGVVAALLTLSVAVHEAVQYLRDKGKRALFHRTVELSVEPPIDAYVFLDDGQYAGAVERRNATTRLSIPSDKRALNIRSSQSPGEKTDLFCRLNLNHDGDTAVKATFRRAGISWVRNSENASFADRNFFIDSIDGQLFAPSDNAHNLDFMMCEESEHELVLRSQGMQCKGTCRIGRDSPNCVVRYSEFEASCLRQAGAGDPVSSDSVR